jgi:DNA-binding PadR family transcriptional regulator
MAPKELLILRLLQDNARGLYGSELVHLSGGLLSRGGIYTLLERLVDKGMVREVDEEPTPELQLRRTRHFITGQGQRACEEFASAYGFAIQKGSLLGGIV